MSCGWDLLGALHKAAECEVALASCEAGEACRVLCMRLTHMGLLLLGLLLLLLLLLCCRPMSGCGRGPDGAAIVKLRQCLVLGAMPV